MVKGFLSALILVISLNLGARTSPYFIDHDAFVHMSQKEQQQILVSFMQFMVEMEDAYEKQVATSAPNSEEVERLVVMLKVFQNLLLSSALAQDEADPFQVYREKFEKTLIKVNTPQLARNGTPLAAKENICIYGGWISTTNSKNICIHPATSPLNSYTTGKQKVAAGRIACNPLVFGYKDSKNKTLFTAVANSSSINSSLDCMKQSQSGTSEEIKIRLKTLQDAYSSPSFKNQYNMTAKFIHQTCLCNDGTNRMNKKYLAKIQPHRTCFSLLNQYRYLRANDCSMNLPGLSLNVDMMEKFQEKILTMENGLANLEITTEDKMSLEYRDRLKDLDASFKNLLGTTEEQKEYCKAQNEETMSCKILNCSNAGQKISCKVEVVGTKSKKDHKVDLDSKGSATIKNLIPIQGIAKQSVTCTLALPACEVGPCAEGKCKVIISNGTAKEEFISFAADEKSKTIPVTPEGLTGEIPVICLAPPKEAVCEVSKCTQAAGDGKICEFVVKGGELKDKDQKTFLAKKDEKEVTISLAGGKEVICQVKDEEKKSSCALDVQAIKDDPAQVDVTLTLSMAEKDKVIAPTWNPAITALPVDDKKLVYKGKMPLASLNGSLMVTNFSTLYPEEKCSETYPKSGKVELEVTAKKDPKVINLYIVIAVIKPAEKEASEKDKVTWAGDELEKVSPLVVKVKQSPEKEKKVCAELDGVEECATIPKVEEENYTLKLAGKNKSNKSFEVTASVGTGEKDLEALDDGLTLVWYEKGKPEPSQDEKDKKKKDEDVKKVKKPVSKGRAGDEGEDADADAEKSVTNDVPEQTEGEVQSGTDLTYAAPITSSKYQICAKLMKGGKQVASDCKPVPSYLAPLPGQQGPMPAPGAYRYRRW